MRHALIQVALQECVLHYQLEGHSVERIPPPRLDSKTNKNCHQKLITNGSVKNARRSRRQTTARSPEIIDRVRDMFTRAQRSQSDSGEGEWNKFEQFWRNWRNWDGNHTNLIMLSSRFQMIVTRERSLWTFPSVDWWLSRCVTSHCLVGQNCFFGAEWLQSNSLDLRSSAIQWTDRDP